MANNFNGKVILITGGTSGIGKALALEFLALKAKVAVCARSEQDLKALEQEAANSDLIGIRADVSRKQDCQSLVKQVLARFGSLDILVNNAGISMRALFRDLEDLSPLEKLMEINFWGSVYCTWYALPYLKASKGVVVGVSSTAGYRGLPGRTGYSASKFALQGFLEALRTEELHGGVHVMWVCPGFTRSNIRNTALDRTGQSQSESPLEESKLMSAEEVARRMILAIGKRKRTLLLTPLGKLTIWINKIFPGFADRLVYNHFRKEPGSPLV